MPINDYTKSPLSWMPDPKAIAYPQYLSLAAALEQDIESGALPAGTRLPPQRALADYLDLNFTTVTRAYELCREKRLIYGEVGRGTFVAPRSEAFNADPEIIELGVVLGFPNMTQQIVEAAHEVISKSYCRDLFSYTEREGMRHQRDAGVQWMKSRGITTDVEHTAIFAGTQNAITTALLSLFRMGDCIAADSFTYANLIAAAKLAHIRVLPVLGDAFGMRPDALEALCKSQKVAGIFLMPDCANPTTCTMPDSRRDAIAEICQKYRLTILEDDSSILCSPYRSFHSRVPDQTLYIAAATRHIASGLRITFVSFPENYKQALLRGLFATSIKASALDAEIISQMILTGKADELLSEKHILAEQANQIYNHVFPEDPLPGSTGSFFRMHPINGDIGGQEWEKLALGQQIRLCHSCRFCILKKPDQYFLRISLSSTKTQEQLRRGLMRLRELQHCLQPETK